MANEASYGAQRFLRDTIYACCPDTIAATQAKLMALGSAKPEPLDVCAYLI
jgi:hypothetical protein